jgi:hypothetical protein
MITDEQALTDLLVSMFPSGGYFVEAGAHDGVGDSQTYRLEQLGWDGLCVEPSNCGVQGLRKNRRCSVDNRVLWDRSGEVKFWEARGDFVELSGVHEAFHFDEHNRARFPFHTSMRQCDTLTTVLSDHDAPPVIEFLSLDTEGSELVILAAHDFERYRFRFIQVEYCTEQRRKNLLELLTPKGYLVYEDGGRDIYLVDVRQVVPRA